MRHHLRHYAVVAFRERLLRRLAVALRKPEVREPRACEEKRVAVCLAWRTSPSTAASAPAEALQLLERKKIHLERLELAYALHALEIAQMLYVEARNAAREYRDYRVWPLGRRNERLRERRSPDLDGDERAETEREGDEHPEMALARGAPRRRLERSHRKRGLEREQSPEERDERRRYDARGDAGDAHGSAGRERLGIARNVDAERRERGKSADGKPAEGEELRLFRDKLRDAKAREADHPEDRELTAARLDGKKERVDEQAQRRERGGPEKKALRAVHVAPRVGHEHRRGLLCRDRLERLPVLVDLRDGGGREEHVGIAAHRTLPFDEARDPDGPRGGS